MHQELCSLSKADAMSGSEHVLTEMPWLLRSTPQLRKNLSDLCVEAGVDWGIRLRELASTFLDVNQAIVLAKAHEKLRKIAPSPSLVPFRLGILSTGTTDLLKPLIVASGLRHGLSVEIVTGDFGDLVQQALDPASRINSSRPDAVLIAADYRGLPLRTSAGGQWPIAAPQDAISFFDTTCAAIRSNSGALCLVQNLPLSPLPLLGSLDSVTAGTTRHAIGVINRHLAESVPPRGDLLLDIEWLSHSIGLDQWYDERMWNIGRLPCAQNAMPLYSDFIARMIGAMRGKSRKCLILDLDNTIWGGVIGDDGIDGIQISIGDARGESFRMVQQAALDLSRRGVVLAVCSKNDEQTARAPFRNHSSMLLRESDIAAFLANWDDKATNIERIAKQLNLGIDSMVLLDDNPAERAQVRLALPLVAVPEIGSEPSRYPALLAAAGYFETTSLTREDALRVQEYRGNALRDEVLHSSRDLDEFLRSLDMSIEFAHFDAAGRKRITQLINKTNQFNLTTRRYTEKQVEELERSDDWYTLQVSVRDRFGDSGMIGVVIARRNPHEWLIDSWLMSCRVFNRRIEHAVCNYLLSAASAAGAKFVKGEFIPTERNSVVSDLYANLGFSREGNSGLWVMATDSYEPLPVSATILVR